VLGVFGWWLVHWGGSFDFRRGTMIIMQFSSLLNLKISWALGLFNSYKASKRVVFSWSYYCMNSEM
jgi:hypothetical protein